MNRADRRKTAKTQKERVEDYINAGRQILESGGNPKEAQRFFKQVLAIEPNHGMTNINLGILEMWARNYPKASEYFQVACRAEPQNTNALNNLALSLHEQGRVEEAIDIYGRALALDDNNVEAHVNLARALAHTGKAKEGLAEAQKAIAINPEFGTGQFMLGTIAQGLGETELATKALGETVRLMPGHMEANFRLCREIFQADNSADLLEPSRAVYESNKDNPEAALCYSELLYGLERHDEAIAILTQHAETANPRLRLNVINGLANINADKGALEEAVAYHKKALTIASDDPHTRYFYGRTLNMMSDYQGAVVQIQKAMPAMQGSQEAIAQFALAQKNTSDTKPFDDEIEKLVVEIALEPSEVFETIDALNEAIIKGLSEKEQTPVHPLDLNRRMAPATWEAVLGSQGSEALAILGNVLQDKISAYVADMPDGFDNHPLMSRRKFGIGNTRTWAESFTTCDDVSMAIDQSGWFKAIYFAAVPDTCADEKTKSGWLRLGVPNVSTRQPVAPAALIKPEAGKLVIFPAYYWHGFTAMNADTPMTITTLHIGSRG